MTGGVIKTRDDILKSNIDLHKIEAPHYEAIHPEEFNWFEQGNISRDIMMISRGLPEKASALDIGCGTGNILLKLVRAGIDVTGVDISKEMADALGARIAGAGTVSARIIVQDIDRFLETCDNEFDLIAISSVLHHLPDFMATLGSVISKIRPGGWLYITHEPTKDALGPDPILRKALWQIDSIVYGLISGRSVHKTGGADYRTSDYHLYRGFDEDKVLERCGESPMKIVRFSKYASTMRTGLSCWIDTKLLGSSRTFSLIARKKEAVL